MYSKVVQVLFILLLISGCVSRKPVPDTPGNLSAETNIKEQDPQKVSASDTEEIIELDAEGNVIIDAGSAKSLGKDSQNTFRVKKMGLAESSRTGDAGKERTHTVWLWQETNECLWNLAIKYYGDPWLWKKIYLANSHQIKDPEVIYPKQVLIIPALEESER